MKISIITATYNSEKTLQDTIDSVYSQNYQHIEYIVIDGNSTDRTIEIIKRNEHKITRWVSETDKGIYHAINKGISISSGDIIGLLHSDDYYADNNVISTIMKHFRSTQKTSIMSDVVMVDRVKTDVVRRFISAKNFKPWHLKLGLMPGHPGFFTYRKNFTSHGAYNLQFKIAADFEILVRFFLKQNLKYEYVPITAVRMRIGGTSTSKFPRTNISILTENLQALSLNGIKSSYLLLSLKIILKLNQFILFSGKKNSNGI